MELSPHRLTAAYLVLRIRSLIGLVIFRPVEIFQCSTPQGYMRREPKSSFGENQLLPNSISFSLLTTRHPRVLHGSPVRASIRLSANFTLRVASSSGFGSLANNKRPIQTWFPCDSGLSSLVELLAKTRWLILQ